MQVSHDSSPSPSNPRINPQMKCANLCVNSESRRLLTLLDDEERYFRRLLSGDVAVVLLFALNTIPENTYSRLCLLFTATLSES